MRDGHLKPEVFYATNQMKKKPNLDKIVKYLPNTRISSKKYKIDNQVHHIGLEMGDACPVNQTVNMNFSRSDTFPMR